MNELTYIFLIKIRFFIISIFFCRSSCEDGVVPTGGEPLAQTQYNKGDFVYVQLKKGQQETNIVQIERLWTNQEDVPMLYGNVYYKSVYF